MRHSSKQLSVLVVEPAEQGKEKINFAIGATGADILLRFVNALTEAYDFAEHHQPDVVILNARHPQQSGFAMFVNMLSACSIDWYVLEGQTGLEPPIDHKINRSTLQTPGALKAFLLSRHLDRNPYERRLQARLPKDPASPGTWKTVVIGASTGGIEALLNILSQYPQNCPPTLIVQHLRPSFVAGLALRLDRYCAARVRPAQALDKIEPGLVLLAPGQARHLSLSPDGSTCHLQDDPSVEGHRPSIDVLFSSASVLKEDAIGVLLTGMGRDGALGLSKMRQNGAHTIAQDDATSTVYGMPRAAVDLNAVCEQLPVQHIAPAILKAAARTRKAAQHA